MESLAEKIKRVTREGVEIVPYDPGWPALFAQEKDHLLSLFSGKLIKRIEHFGSTAVPGLSAKPVVDMLVEVNSLCEAKEKIAPVLESSGYDYFWRPTFGDDGGPFYCWFIKRDSRGKRTHHIHMIEGDSNPDFQEHWERLLLRDYLCEHSGVRQEYEKLKITLSRIYPQDRVEYSRQKGEFIAALMQTIKGDSSFISSMSRQSREQY